MITKNDVILAAVLLALALGSYLAIGLAASQNPGNALTVSQNGSVILKLDRSQIDTDGTYEFDFDKGKGYVEVKSRKVRMVPMDASVCPESVCSDTGWISGAPQTIVCLPNRLTVQFETAPDGGSVDIII